MEPQRRSPGRAQKLLAWSSLRGRTASSPGRPARSCNGSRWTCLSAVMWQKSRLPSTRLGLKANRGRCLFSSWPWFSKAGPAGKHGLGFLLVMPALQRKAGGTFQYGRWWWLQVATYLDWMWQCCVMLRLFLLSGSKRW